MVEDNLGDFEYFKELYFDKYADEFTLTHCADISSVLEQAEKDFDLILLDLDLPDSRGANTIHVVKQTFPCLPIVVITGRKEPLLISEALENGAHDYVIKGDLSEDVFNRIIHFSISRHRHYRTMQNSTMALEKINEKLFEKVKETKSFTPVNDDKMAHLAHEIRGPVTLMSCAIDLLEEAEEKSEKSHLRKTLKSACLHLEKILNAFLNEEKEAEDVPETLGLVIDQITSLVIPRAHEKALEVKSIVDPQARDVICEIPTKLRQILINLINNSIKFTTVGGITLEALKSEESILFKVSDTGPGVDQNFQGKIFEDNYKGYVANSTDKSFGHGLYISQRIARKSFKTKIKIDSSSGEGATFYFSIPLGGSLKTPNLKINQILVIDDSEEMRDLYKHMLKKRPDEVTYAESVTQALNLLFSVKFDLVLSDYILKDETIGDLLVKVSDSKNATTPFVVISGTEFKKLEKYKKYVTDILPKPIKMDELFQEIDRHLRK